MSDPNGGVRVVGFAGADVRMRSRGVNVVRADGQQDRLRLWYTKVVSIGVLIESKSTGVDAESTQ